MNQPSLEEELFAAVCHNEVDTVVKLLAAGADVNARLHAGMTPLMQAARAGAHAVLPLLLVAGADVHAQDALYGRTAFHWLCRHGLPSHYHPEVHLESARALLDAGADAYRPDPFGETPLLLAIRRGMQAVIRLIHCVDPFPNGSGDKLLFPWLDAAWLRRHAGWAAEVSDAELLAPPAPWRRGAGRAVYGAEWARQADLAAVDRRGFTALHHAAGLGLTEVAAILIDRGAEVDAAARSGATPLMVAARGGQWRVGQLLLACGADLERCDVRGRSAVEMARRAGNRRLFL